MENMNGLATVEFVNKIEELVEKAHEKYEEHKIGDDLYTTKELYKIYPEQCDAIYLNSLDALIDFVRTTVATSKEKFEMPLIIRTSHDEISVISSLDKDMNRNKIAVAKPILPKINFDFWMSMEEFIIQLQTCFVHTENQEKLISLVSHFNSSTEAEITDDGLGQNVTIKSKSGLNSICAINPIVKLQPYLTYYETEQPETMFLVRVRDGGELRIIEADGGSWKQIARKRVSDYLNSELDDLIESGDVVVVG